MIANKDDRFKWGDDLELMKNEDGVFVIGNKKGSVTEDNKTDESRGKEKSDDE